MIGLQLALAAEAVALLEALSGRRDDMVCGRPVVTGRLAGHEVLLAVSGIGKVAAAMTATLLVRRASVVLVVGTAGGLSMAVAPGDIVVATAALQHDLDARPLVGRWQQPEAGISRFPTAEDWTAALLAAADGVAGVGAVVPGVGWVERRRHVGLVVSGDRFINSHEVAQRLRDDLPEALAVDMESAAVAQVCRAAGVPCGIVRTVSDHADSDAGVDFDQFLASAAPLHRDLVMKALIGFFDPTAAAG